MVREEVRAQVLINLLGSNKSHGTIEDIIKGGQPSPETIRKLTQGFGGDGINERLVLEDTFMSFY